MAVGDVISGVFNTINTNLYFQPAVNVEVVILCITGQHTGFQAGLYDGVTAAKTDLQVHLNFTNVKLGITNTNYFNIYFNGQGGYSGIQIK